MTSFYSAPTTKHVVFSSCVFASCLTGSWLTKHIRQQGMILLGTLPKVSILQRPLLAMQGAPAVDGLCEVARRLRRLPALDPLLPTVRHMPRVGCAASTKIPANVPVCSIRRFFPKRHRQSC